MDFGRFLEQWTVSTVFPPLWNALAAEKEQRNTAEMDFVKEVLVDVNERMVRLEKLVDEEYMKTEDFRNFLHKMLLKAALDLRREKKNLGATGTDTWHLFDLPRTRPRGRRSALERTRVIKFVKGE